MKLKNKFIQLIISVSVILLLSYLLSLKFFRLDLTSEGRYTLSNYTKSMLSEIDDIIFIKVYLSGKDLPINFKKMEQAVKEELEEFKIYANNNIEFEFINPSESADKNIRFSLYKTLQDKGIFPIETQELSEEGKTSLKMVFPGAIVSYGKNSQTINLLKSTTQGSRESERNINNSIQSLEYEFTNAIQKLLKTKKQKIAFIHGHGELDENHTFSMSNILAEYYDVYNTKINGTPEVLNQYKAIIIAKPRAKFSEQDKFVIDQYIINGGNVLWLVEGTNTVLDSLYTSRETLILGQDLNLNDQIFKYGARINSNLILDKKSSVITLPDRAGELKQHPWFYFPVVETDNNHSISKYLDFIKTEFICSVDTVGEDADIKKTILLKTSKLSKSIDASAGMLISLYQVNMMPTDAQLNSGRQNVAVLLEGKFKSVFKNRNLSTFFPENPYIKFKAENKHAKMIVVGDGDIIKNEVSKSGQQAPVGFDKFSRYIFKGNQEFVLNSLNYLCDDDGLMTIRSRELKMRLLDKQEVKKNKHLIQAINIHPDYLPLHL